MGVARPRARPSPRAPVQPHPARAAPEGGVLGRGQAVVTADHLDAPSATRVWPRRAAGWARLASGSTTTRPGWWRSPTSTRGSYGSSRAGNARPASWARARPRRPGRLEGCRGTDEDVAVIRALLQTVTYANRCYLGTEEQLPLMVSRVLRAFPEEFAAHTEGDRPRLGTDLLAHARRANSSWGACTRAARRPRGPRRGWAAGSARTRPAASRTPLRRSTASATGGCPGPR